MGTRAVARRVLSRKARLGPSTATALAWLRRARALAFDLDGTLVDSNAIKRRAFLACYDDAPAHAAAIEAYYDQFQHVARDEKFRHVCERILGVEYTPQTARRLHERFATDTTAQVGAAPEVPGAEAFLRACEGRGPMALLSGTPHEILEQIVRVRGWQGRFAAVQGAPVAKADWLRRFQQRLGIEPEELIFFGDVAEDARAAGLAGCRFVGIGDPWPGPAEACALPDFRVLGAAASRRLARPSVP